MGLFSRKRRREAESPPEEGPRLIADDDDGLLAAPPSPVPPRVTVPPGDPTPSSGVRVLGPTVRDSTPSEGVRLVPAAPGPPPAEAGEDSAPTPPDGTPIVGPPPRVVRIGFDESGELPDPLQTGLVTSTQPSHEGVARTVTVDVTAGTASGARRVIRIGDEDEQAPPKDATSPTGMDPRVRARRISVRRAMGRRRLRWVVLGGLAVVVAVAAVVVLRSPLLAVDRVEVDGAAYMNREALAELVRDLEGSPVVSLDLGAVRSRLEADPWVKRARVERAWPRTVRIEVVERVPVAAYMGDDQGWRVVDSAGAVIAVLEPGHQPVDLVTIAADAAPDLAPGDQVPAAIGDAASVAPRLPDALRQQVRRIAVGSEGIDLVLDRGVVRLGSPDQLRDKLISTMVAMEELGPERLAALAVLDVRAPRNPVATCDPVEACILTAPAQETTA